MDLQKIYQDHRGYVSDKWDSYIQIYGNLFSPLRSKPVSLLEVGVQNGGSLEIWSKYFQNAQLILGCDINPICGKLSFENPKIKVIIGNITNIETLSLISSEANLFDVIIDDGSHKSNDIVQTFCHLFPKLKNDGIFVIEDLHCSYWHDWEGGLIAPHSSMSFLKSLIDILNYEHWEDHISRIDLVRNFDIPDSINESILSEIHSIEFFNSTCIIRRRDKAHNQLGLRQVVGVQEPVVEVKSTNRTASVKPSRQDVDNAKMIEDAEQLCASLEQQLIAAVSRLKSLKT